MRLEVATSPAPAPVARATFLDLGESGKGAKGDSVIVTVAKRGQADYRTIGEAIHAAGIGARIVVGPGTYYESVVIDRPVAIEGNGPRAEIVIECGNGECLRMETDQALVQGLTLRGRGPTATGERSVVLVRRGQLRLVACDVASDLDGPAVRVAGRDANPTIRRCRIHRSKGGGVLFEESANGTLDDCELVANRTYGVATRTGATPLVRSCAIEGGGNGIFVTEHGLGRFELCDLSGNELAVRINEAGNPFLWRCKIHDAKTEGVSIYEAGEGTLDDCKVYGNARAGVSIERGGNPHVRWCKIHGGLAAGVAVLARGQGTIEDCQIVDNATVGVAISTSALPIVRRCRIRRNQHVGVSAKQGGQGSIEECDLTGNGRGAWEIEPGCRVRRLGNKE
jgi:F-box protein 11